MKKMLKTTLAVAALAGMGAAQAAVITFDGLADSPLAPFMPLLGHNEEFYQSGMWIDPWSTKAGASAGDLVGALVNGSDLANTCVGVVCPSNNASTFYTALNDSQLYLGNVNGSKFQMASFDAGFVAASGDVIPPLALILRVDGYSGSTKIASQDFNVAGPTGGAYSFSTYAFNAAFMAAKIDQVVFYGYNCNAAGSCGRSSDKAQFALDNITTAVPEASTWMMMGLGLAAFGAFARRRNAA